MAVQQCLGIFHSVVLIAVLTVFLFQITNVSPTESPQEIDRKQRSQSSSKDSTDQPSSSLENSKVSLFLFSISWRKFGQDLLFCRSINWWWTCRTRGVSHALHESCSTLFPRPGELSVSNPLRLLNVNFVERKAIASRRFCQRGFFFDLRYHLAAEMGLRCFHVEPVFYFWLATTLPPILKKPRKDKKTNWYVFLFPKNSVSWAVKF